MILGLHAERGLRRRLQGRGVSGGRLVHGHQVNGPGRDPVYGVLTESPDAAGDAGDIQWNFEKFVVGADGRVLGRFRPRTEPDAPEVRDCIQRARDAS